MPIFTRFGSEVEIVGATLEKGWIDVQYVNHPKDIKYTHLNDLKADGGIAEIQEMCLGLPKAKDLTKR